MSKYVEMTFCKVIATPYRFDPEKFKAGDAEQLEKYKKAKQIYQKTKLTFEEISDEDKPVNYARFVPEGCMFIDFDNPEEAEEMLKIILHSKLRCLILKTMHGYHFLFRAPSFYENEMTGATNWFGYKFDAKGSKGVQIMRACGMDREERCSWDMDSTVIPASLNIETLDILPYWLWGKLSAKDLHKGGKPRKECILFR